MKYTERKPKPNINFNALYMYDDTLNVVCLALKSVMAI